MKLLKTCVFLSMLFIGSVTLVMAGGGRIELQKGLDGYTNEQIPIYGYVHKGGGSYEFNEGEAFDVLIQDPRPGDTCILTQPVVDKFGSVVGYCTATTPGQIIPYLKSKVNGDVSGGIVLYITERVTPTVSATAVTTAKPTVAIIVPLVTRTTSHAPISLSLTPVPNTLIKSAQSSNAYIFTLLFIAAIILLVVLYLIYRMLKQRKNMITKEPIVSPQDTLPTSEKPHTS